MRFIAGKGELGLALLFAGVGALWIFKGARMPVWGDSFAPDSGFLPLIYGCLLAGLSAAVFLQVLLDRTPPADDVRKPLTVIAALAVAVAALPYAGFVAAVFGLLLFLYAAVEKLPWLSSTLASAGTTGVLYLIFKVWLGVPLPAFFP
jgi:hypothetical protein